MSNGYPANNVYIGARYVPKLVGEWDSTKETAYEPLIIVTYQGDSYTSRQYVPAGIDISNTEYWVLTGNFNGQIESFRLALEALNNRVKNAPFVLVDDYGAIGDGVTDDSAAITEASRHGIIMGYPDKKYRIASDCYIYNSSMLINFLINDEIVVRFDSDNTAHLFDSFEVPLDEVKKHTGRGSFNSRVPGHNNVSFYRCRWIRGTNHIALTQSNDISFLDCVFERAYQTAFAEGGNGYALFITDKCNNVSVVNNTFRSIGRHAIYLSKDIEEATPNDNILISGNVFDWSNIDTEELPVQGMETDTPISIRYSTNVQVINNSFKKTAGFVEMIPNTDDLIGNITIANNNMLARPDYNQYGIHVSSLTNHDISNVKINGNTISCYFGTSTVQGEICNNVFEQSESDVVVYTLNPQQSCFIKNNYFNGRESGVAVSSNNNVVNSLYIVGNTFNSHDTVGFVSRGGRAQYVLLAHNIFLSNPTFTNLPYTVGSADYNGNIRPDGKKMTPFLTTDNARHAFDDSFSF